MKELEELIERAKKNLPSGYIQIRSNRFGWHLVKEGNNSEDLLDATFEEVVAKLREWAKPKKPAFVTITIPFHTAEIVATKDKYPAIIMSLCKEAIKPYEVQP